MREPGHLSTGMTGFVELDGGGDEGLVMWLETYCQQGCGRRSIKDKPQYSTIIPSNP